MNKKNQFLSLKKAIFVLIGLSTLLLSNSALAQNYNLRFVRVSNDGTTMAVKVQMSLTSAGDLGSSNLVFTYDGAEVNTPTLSTAHNFSGGNYGTMTVTSPATNTVSINMELQTDNAGTALATGANWTDVATINFTLPNTAGTANFQWQVSGTQKTVVFLEDNSTQLTQGTLTNNDMSLDATKPTVTSVSSSTANGSYNIGDVVAVTVTFSENVTVTGTPQIELETGTTDRTVNYSSGSGGTTLTFNYTVQSGDESADLDYKATSSLTLNGGTINDAADNTATLTLATPGAANSLGNNKALVIDGVVPTVTSVSSSTANGTKKVGDVVAVSVTFSEAVTVTGTPQIELETGTTDRTVNYTSGSGGTTLTFNYTVQAGDESADLDYKATSSLTLNSGTINDAAGNAATLTLATPGAANSLGNNKALVIDGVVPTVTSVSSSTANGTKKVGDVVAVTVTFSEAVTVTGTPQIELETGTTDRTVNYTSGSGGTTLTFNYTVQTGDESADLDYKATSSLTLNGGTINDAAGNAATLTLATPGAANSLANNKALVIDGVVPTVTSVSSSTANDSYNAGDVIAVTVTFSEAVTVTGTPQLELETGTTDRTVNYTSGSGGTTLTFNYTVQAGDTNADLDYKATSSLTLNGGTIDDGAGNAATLTLATPGAANSLGNNKALVIDTTAPTVTSVSSSTANGSYNAGDVIAVTVTFSEAVTVTGTPQIELETGTTDRTVNYTSGSGGTTLTFNYTVQAGDTNADLDYKATSSLTLNGGTINDGAGNAATLTLASPGAANSLGNNKALVIDTTAPTVTSVSSNTANGAKKLGDVIAVTVTFSEAVTVTGTPQIELETGTTDRTVNYTSGSGTSTLTFNYTVQAGDESADLDYKATTSLTLNSGTINDAAGNAATLILATPGAANSLGNNKALVIDGVVPTVTSVSSSTANGSYNAGDVIAVTVTFSEAVTVTGTPQIELETGTTDRTVNYTSGSGGTTLTFNYTVQAGDTNADLDYKATSSLTLNGGTINDGTGNAATLTLATPGAANSLGNNKALVIDTTAPTVTSVSSSTANGTKKVGDVVAVTVTFSEAVTVTGTPQLELETGATDRTVNYTSGSGGTTLTFNYTVQAGDESADLDYKASTSLTLNSGTINDAAGNAATLTLATPGAANSLGNNKALVIDGVVPTVISVSSSTANGSYNAGDVIAVTVTFSEAVIVTGTPQIELETGTTDRTVNYTSGSGGTTLTFNYTVQAGDTNADLDYKATGSLTLNGGTINDVAGNAATLTLATPGAANSLGNNKALVIDTTAPTVTSVSSSTANGAKKLGDVIAVTVTFSEAVTVTGTPQIELETGTTDRTVNYTSGSGTTTLTFNYTVQAGDESADLDYKATSSLTLNGGTINDVAGNVATLTLATPGAANSLGNNKALVIDGVVPTVTDVTSTKANGTYGIGEVIAVTVTFSEAVTVTGTPQLALETGLVDRTVDYASGSGTTTLTFTYTTQSGDESADLDYKATNSLSLNGGTIKDGAGNDATLTLASPGAANSLGNNKALVIEAFPTVTLSVGNSSIAEAAGTSTVTATLSQASSQDVVVTIAYTGTAVNGTDYNNTASTTITITAGQTSVNAAVGVTATQDASPEGNETIIIDITGVSKGIESGVQQQTITIIDDDAAVVTSVSSTKANGSYKTGEVIAMTVTFNQAVTVTGTPQLELETGTTDRTIDYASGSGSTVLTFNYTVQAGDTNADLDYKATGSLTLNGGTIKNGAIDAILTLAAPGAANSLGANKALVIDTTAPTVTSVTSSTANGTKKVGDVIAVTVTFSESVTVTGTPQIELETGTTDRIVNYTSGSGTTTLTFNYTVQAGDESADLDYKATSSLTLNSGTINDGAGNAATLTLATPGAANSLGNNKALVIDGVVPTVTSVSSSTANGSYNAGDVIAVTVTFSEAVTVTGTPQLELETGTTDRTVNYTSGSGGTTLTFNYTVQAGDTNADLDYKATTSLTLNGGTINDGAGNAATLTLATPGVASSLGNNKALVIDTTVPTVTDVTSSTANGTKKLGDVIAVTVTFSEAVTVTGTPQLELETGTTDRTVDYTSGSGTTTLTFNYTVQAGDESADLDYKATSSLTLNSGTINDAAGNAATLTLATPGAANSLGNNKALVIDGVVPTITSVSSSTANGSYKAGDVIAVTVTFSEAVTVTGTPQIELETGTTDRTVNYTSGSGGTTLTFNYTVQAGDTNADLDYKATTSLTLNGGMINDGAGNAATLTLATPGAAGSLGGNKALVIDTTAPTVTNVSSGTANGTYKIGGAIAVTVTFSEAVTVTGTPQLELQTGTTDRKIDYSSGSGTTILTFNYAVQAGDESADLDYKATTSLALNGGTINDGVGNTAILTLAATGAAGSLGANKALVIDGIVPTITNVSSSTADGTYKVGDVINVTVTFSENVTVTGTPQITLETGGTDRTIDYVSGSGTTMLSFSYTVQVGDNSNDLDYAVTNPASLNGGTIKDGAGNDASLTLAAPGAANSLGANKAIVIDGVLPTVTSVSSTKADGTYGIGEVIAVTVTFSEAVTVTGTPQLALETGLVDRTVDYSSGSGTTTLTFTYTTQSGDESADVDYKATNSLSLNGGTIKDGAGNDATLTLASPGAANSLGNNKALVIEAFPTVTLSVGNSSIAEAAGTSTVTATLSQTSSQDVVVTIAYTGTAVNGTDYNSSASTTITITAGQTSANAAVGVTATQDASPEGSETIIIDITGVSKGIESGVQQQTITIIDDDAAVVTSVNSSAANGNFKLGDVIAVTVTFNQAVTVTGTPQLELETGTTDRTVDYVSGSGTTTLTFNYTVQAGDASNDLDYKATGSLTLNSGTIKNGGIDAILTLAAPGAAGSLGANKALVVDGVVPAVPAVTGITTDSGSSATDEITNDNTLSFNGTAEANATVEVFIGGVSIGTTNANGSGVWSFDHTGTTLADATYSVTAKATDAAGNTSASSTALSVIVDTATPLIPSIDAITDDTGSANFDFTTNDNKVVFSGTAEANGTVELFIDATSIGTTTANGSGTWSFDYTGTTLADNSYTVTAKTTDAAGNVSNSSTASTLVIDTAAPAAPAVTSITTDSGTNGSDQITNDNTLNFNGTAEANATVEVFIGGVSIGTTNVNGSGVWSFDHTGTTLADATYSVIAKATDLAGNTSASSAALPVTVDVAAPAVPAVTSITTDTGSSGTDEITNDQTLSFNGTAEANTSVEVFIGVVSIGTTNANGSGVWSFDHTGTTLADATYSVTAKATDAAGNTSASSTALSVIVDTAGPTLTITAVDVSTGTALTAGQVNNGAFTVTIAFSESVADFVVGDISVTNGSASSFSGSGTTYTATITPAADGTVIVTMNTGVGSDTAGNGNTATSFTITNDETVPGAPVITDFTTDAGNKTSGTSTSDNTLKFNGTAELSSTVEVFIDGASIGTTIASGTGAWVFDHTGTTLAEATYAVTAKAIDMAGNKSASSTVLSVTVDINAPVPSLTKSVGTITNATFTTTITYNEEVSGFVLGDIQVTNGTASNFTSVTAGRVWTATITPTADGAVTIDVPGGTATDAAGNANTASNELTVTYDATSPTLTMSSDKANPTNVPFTITMIFNESISSFTIAGMGVTNGTLSNFVRNSSFVYKVLVTPAADGLVTVDVNAGAGQDNAGNNNIARQLTTTFDGTVPTVTVAAPSAIVSGTFTATFTFSEAVNGFSLGGITVTNGSASSFTAVSSTVYTASITPTASGTVTVAANAGAGADVANNGNTAGDVSVNYNRAPTDITLSSASILENSGIGAEIGTMSTTDPDVTDIHIYTLVSGTGDTDNGDFIMVGDKLTALSDFDRETKSSYSIRVETDDGNGGKFEKQFTITIDNVAEADMRVTGDLQIPGTALGTTSTFNVTVHNDGDANLVISTITYPTAFGGPVTGITITPGNNQVLNLTFSPTAAITYSGDIIITSNGGTATLAVSADGSIITAVDEPQLTAESVSIYPNPAKDVLNVDLSQFNGKTLEISIHDVNGIKRFTKTNHTEGNLTIDVSGYSSGIYLMLFNDGKQIVQKKVVIKQ